MSVRQNEDGTFTSDAGTFNSVTDAQFALDQKRSVEAHRNNTKGVEDMVLDAGMKSLEKVGDAIGNMLENSRRFNEEYERNYKKIDAKQKAHSVSVYLELRRVIPEARSLEQNGQYTEAIELFQHCCDFVKKGLFDWSHVNITDMSANDLYNEYQGLVGDGFGAQMGSCYFKRGIEYENKKQYEAALNDFFIAEEISKQKFEVNDYENSGPGAYYAYIVKKFNPAGLKEKIASCYFNIGLEIENKNSYLDALKYYTNALNYGYDREALNKHLENLVAKLKPLAQAGDDQSANTLFTIFDNYIFCKNPMVSSFIDSYEQSANQGNDKAQFQLGLYYYKYKKNYNLAKKWLEKAAAQGNKNAQELLVKVEKEGAKKQEARKERIGFVDFMAIKIMRIPLILGFLFMAFSVVAAILRPRGLASIPGFDEVFILTVPAIIVYSVILALIVLTFVAIKKRLKLVGLICLLLSIGGYVFFFKSEHSKQAALDIIGIERSVTIDE